MPVFCAVGEAGREGPRTLRLDRRVRLVRSPRHASLLLAIGRIPAEHHDALRLVHDQVCPPRATAVWGGGGAPPLPGAVEIEAGDDPVPILERLHDELLDGHRPSAPVLGPRDNPVAWQGVGPHGQGGAGMMGGAPYGRPMAMTGPDERDGLQLDRVPVTLGPFLPWLPPGMRLVLELQGDVLQSLEVDVATLRHRDEPAIFGRALTRDVPLADLEIARARHHLAATAELLLVLGLDAVAERVLRLARDARPGSGGAVRSLARALKRNRSLALSTRGIGALSGDRLPRSGPAARAAGRGRDARSDDPAYQEIGFEPVVFSSGDAEARWLQRLAEAAQALDLAERAGSRQRAPGPALEGPRGARTAEAQGTLTPDGQADELGLLEELAPGLSFEAFVILLVSLDLDPAERSLRG